MRVLVTGASGFIGSALVPALERRGDRVVRLVRREPVPGHDEIPWNPESGALEASRLEGIEAVIHLAGESTARIPWTRSRKRRIAESRIVGTRSLANTLARLTRPPRVVISASAAGYYGDRGDELLDEESSPGTGFLAGVAVSWEAACDPLREAGVRVICSRTGLVLGAQGGAMKRLVPLFRLGLGGPLGDGRQDWSWIALADVIGVFLFALDHDELDGPVNVVAPEPVPQRDFAATLGRVLGRPAFVPAPAFALRLVLGMMADEMLLAGARIVPSRLRAAGYEYREPELEGALRAAMTGRR